jgi:hypothetical protein
MNTLKIYRNNLPAGHGRLSKGNAGVRISYGNPERAELVQAISRLCKYRITKRLIRLGFGITDCMVCNMAVQQINDCQLSGALPGGNRNSDGSFNNLGSNGNWWSSTESSSTNAWNRNMNSSNGEVNRNNNNKTNSFSVRCLKDSLPTMHRAVCPPQADRLAGWEN